MVYDPIVRTYTGNSSNNSFKGFALLANHPVFWNIHGHGGNDVLEGSLFNDTINGGNGNDFLFGDSGRDLLIGGNGDDLIMGGAGNDTLISGSNADSDIFRFNSVNDGYDTIQDFDTVGGLTDVIHINNNGFNATGGASDLVDGLLSSERLVSGSSSLDNRAGFRYFASSGNLYFDSNGGDFSGSEMVLNLANKPTLSNLLGHIEVI